MSGLDRHLRALIAAKGPLTVAEYMGIALAHPTLGYYRRQDPLGASGDFTTAPEISQMFGELIGLWAAVAWQQMGMPERVALVELGPGRGTLMADALRAAGRVPPFKAACRVHLVETSPALRAAQAKALAGHGPAGDVQWHDSLDQVPEGPAIVIANEFFDALPIRQFVRAEDGWRERMIDIAPKTDTESGRGGGFRFVLGGLSAASTLIPDAVRDAPVASMAEVCPSGLSIAATLGDRLVAGGGAALIIDYGHGHSAPGDTLQAMARHAYADPLAAPGDADLTAHVDFQALARAATERGAQAFGPITQGALLERLGIRQRADTLARAATDQSQHSDIDGALERLIAPTQMGTLFKALTLTAPGLPAPAGFESPDPMIAHTPTPGGVTRGGPRMRGDHA